MVLKVLRPNMPSLSDAIWGIIFWKFNVTIFTWTSTVSAITESCTLRGSSRQCILILWFHVTATVGFSVQGKKPRYFGSAGFWNLNVFTRDNLRSRVCDDIVKGLCFNITKHLSQRFVRYLYIIKCCKLSDSVV